MEEIVKTCGNCKNWGRKPEDWDSRRYWSPVMVDAGGILRKSCRYSTWKMTSRSPAGAHCEIRRFELI
jgi:hypothetical protein